VDIFSFNVTFESDTFLFERLMLIKKII